MKIDIKPYIPNFDFVEAEAHRFDLQKQLHFVQAL